MVKGLLLEITNPGECNPALPGSEMDNNSPDPAPPVAVTFMAPALCTTNPSVMEMP